MSLIRGNALTIPLADNTVDLIVTSPPYFALRSYTDACPECGGSGTERPGCGQHLDRRCPRCELVTTRMRCNGCQGLTKEIREEPSGACPACDGKGGEHYAGQLGSEATPAAFIDALVSVTRECVRVLKPSGSLFVNLGDKYSGAPPGNPGANCPPGRKGDDVRRAGAIDPQGFVRNKSLMGLPWRYALRCIDDLGLILRAEIIWSKPNGLPESVQDRVRRSHEQWFHFALEPRYYSAVDEIREPHVRPLTAEQMATNISTPNSSATRSGRGGPAHGGDGVSDHVNTGSNPLGKLPGSVWTIPTEPLRVPDDLPQHFAAFPSEFPRRIILGWSPSGICCECGEARTAVYEDRGLSTYAKLKATGELRLGSDADTPNSSEPGNVGQTRDANGRSATYEAKPKELVGHACACPTPTAPTRPAVVLDPFAGTGTTVAVANALGRYGVGLDLSADYLRLARWRCNDPGLRAKALGVDKPAPEVPGQMALL